MLSTNAKILFAYADLIFVLLHLSILPGQFFFSPFKTLIFESTVPNWTTIFSVLFCTCIQTSIEEKSWLTYKWMYKLCHKFNSKNNKCFYIKKFLEYFSMRNSLSDKKNHIEKCMCVLYKREKNMIHKILRISIRLASEHEKDILGIYNNKSEKVNVRKSIQRVVFFLVC